MHDIRLIRTDPAGFDAAMARRGIFRPSEELLRVDSLWRKHQTAVESAKASVNAISRQIGEAMKSRDVERANSLKLETSSHNDVIVNEGLAAEGAEAFLQAKLQTLPNILDRDVPDGQDEAGNVVLHQHGDPAASNAAREHFELGEALGLMDFETAARLSGSRFVVLKGALARLERVLGQWMLDLHAREHGYTEVSPPLLVKAPALYGTGQLPKFEEDLFRSGEHYLIPTAEVPLTNLVANQITPEPLEPLRFTALTPSFRSEAGSAGRDTRGMLRQHQFQKVELVSVTRPEDSAAEHERMTACAERVLTELGLTWRRMLLCAGDTGFSAAKTYDLEVWLPGQKAWREISSCSNTRDFQARRMKARFRRGKENLFLHTLNGSGVAVGRALIAIMETHQRPDGAIAIPQVLQPMMGMDLLK